ncbi:ankyrin repeat domain-containing protein 24 [Pimephales promelas]|uniref:ankyrin repeat domain-containing protein 24 n=1 Tax=Pimephales promelas TaxID=90988 RepID=UPI00195590D3|nr:ankyrin repeat domain-containing protein 24 [Pimephales promelas]
MLRPKDLCQGSGIKTFLEAMQSGKVHLARFVLDALDGRIIDGKAENGRTLLMSAVSLQDHGCRAKFAKLLLEKGADVNARDDRGRTALSLACEHGFLDSVKLLVQFNADPELTDTWGNSALMYAACGGHNHVLEFLVRAFKKLGLRLDLTNHAGHSAVQVADFFGHNQCVQALSVCGKKTVSPTNSTGEPADDLRWPNRLPKHVLERFSKQIQSRQEELLPALFQRQMRLSDNLRIHFRRPPASDTNHDLMFASKQIQNSALKEVGGSSDIDAPLWGKARSFNPDHRKQSYQGDVREINRFKRASLQDEKPLVAKFYGATVNLDESQSWRDPRSSRQSRLLPGREELEPERIKPRSSGLSGLGTRLLRRFTAPEFLRHRDCPSGKGKISRSETFPFTHTHVRVNSQPSVDGISAVRCEFESSSALK